MSDPVTVKIYSTLASVGCGPSGRSGCSCSPASFSINNLGDGEDPHQALSRRVEEVKAFFGDSVNIEIINYTEKENLWDSIESLNLAISQSDYNFRITPGNFFSFITNVAPIVLIDGRIAFTREIPTKTDFINQIKNVGIAQQA